MYKLLLATFFILICQGSINAQSQDTFDKAGYQHALEAMVYKGFILKHDTRIGHLVRSNPQGFKINYTKKTLGKNYWEAHYGYPDLGISFGFQDYRNPELGRSLSVVPFISLFPFRTNRSSLSWIMGTGLAYHTRPFHPQDNVTNIALGSSWSAALYVSFRYQIQLSPRLTSGFFLHLDHYSNGGFKKPNLGINLIQGGVSVTHQLTQAPVERKTWKRKTVTNQKAYLSLLPSVSFKELGRGGGEVFPSYNLSIGLNKPVSRVSIVSLSLDGFYDIAMREWITTEEPELDVDFKSAALTLGHELLVDRFSFMLQVGYHFYQPYKGLYQDFYQRYGLRLYLHPKMAVSGSLKAYFGKAEQIEWGLLYRL